MSKVPLFRADKRIFNPGDRIRTAGHFAEMHPEPGKLAETLLSKQRPDGMPERTECLMLFPDENRARDFCARMSGGRLYRVEVGEADIVHRGDMHIVDAISRNYDNGIDDNQELATSYWSGVLSDAPCIEVLVIAGTVTEQLEFSQAEREDRIKAMFGFKTFEPEPYPWDSH